MDQGTDGIEEATDGDPDDSAGLKRLHEGPASDHNNPPHEQISRDGEPVREAAPEKSHQYSEQGEPPDNTEKAPSP